MKEGRESVLKISLKKIGVFVSILASLAVISTSCGFGGFGDKLSEWKDKLIDTELVDTSDVSDETGETRPTINDGLKEFDLYVTYVDGEARLSWDSVSGAETYTVYKNGIATNSTVFTSEDTDSGDTVNVIAFDKGGTHIAYTLDTTLKKSNMPVISGSYSLFTITNGVAATTYYTITSGSSVVKSGTVNAGQSVELAGSELGASGSITVTAYNQSSTAIRSDTVSKTFSGSSDCTNGHTWSEWTNYEDVDHIRTCSVCGASEKEACIFVPVNNGNAAHHDLECNVCGEWDGIEDHSFVNGVCSGCGFV